ncbi:MAG: DNA-3-methyladenine glycosylase 2 family protein [Chloroflexota bacterium]|nr:DNA-3-methyladenine glycosylase 2 family protein [Chloroflexota bacterium]
MDSRSSPDSQTRIRLTGGSDPRLTLAPLWHGPGDPVMRFDGRVIVRALRTPAGAATIRLALGRADVEVQAWGPGATAAIDTLPELLGERDDPAALQPRDRLLRDLHRRLAGLRLTRTGAVMEALLPAIIAQKVTNLEARRSYRDLVRRLGEPAPGPLGLMLPPAPQNLARLPYHDFHRSGIERRRAEAITAAARAASRLEEVSRWPADAARRRLLAVRGVGRWTAAETLRVVLGDADAVSVGDYNLPKLVSWALAGEPRGDEARMLELLEPYRGQRARVVLLLELSGLRPPRYGPRLPPRSITAM